MGECVAIPSRATKVCVEFVIIEKRLTIPTPFAWSQLIILNSS